MRCGAADVMKPTTLIAICDVASKGKRHNETPTVRKPPPLPLRPMIRELQPFASEAARQDVSPPKGKTGPLHGDAASSRVTKYSANRFKGLTCSILEKPHSPHP